jgi:hypothetical protein
LSGAWDEWYEVAVPEADDLYDEYLEELRKEGVDLMSGHTSWRRIRDELRAKPGGKEAISRARQESLEELRLYELRHAGGTVSLPVNRRR